MSLDTETQVATPEEVAQTSEAVVETEQPDAPDTSETTVAETDEQKNEKVQQEAAAKAEKRARGVQKRMDELTADKYAERKRADELATQNARILALLEAKNPQQSAQDGAPNRDQFQDDFSYVRAEAAYIAQQEAAKLFQRATATQQEQFARMQAEQAERQAQQTFIERQKAIEKSLPDFRETIEDADIPMPNSTLAMIRQMEDGPLVAYHLAKNPELAQKLASSPPHMHGIILGQVSATLKAPVQVSKAPPPGKPVHAKPGPSGEPTSEWTGEQYRVWAEKNMR